MTTALATPTTLERIKELSSQIEEISNANIELSSDIMALKAKALERARSITTIEDDDEEKMGVAILAEVDGALRGVEASRLELKSPLTALGKIIDGLAKTYSKELEPEKARIGKVLGSFQAEKRRKAEEAERARLAEFQKAEDERRKAAAANDKPAQEAAAAKVEAIVSAEPIKATKVEGTITRTTLKYRVLDMNALFAARPDLCEILDVKSKVNVAIAVNRNIPGLEVWEESSTTTRR